MTGLVLEQPELGLRVVPDVHQPAGVRLADVVIPAVDRGHPALIDSAGDDEVGQQVSRTIDRQEALLPGLVIGAARMLQARVGGLATRPAPVGIGLALPTIHDDR